MKYFFYITYSKNNKKNNKMVDCMHGVWYFEETNNLPTHTHTQTYYIEKWLIDINDT